MKKSVQLLSQLIILSFFLNAIQAQADKHIDPSPKYHTHTLSIGKHVSTTFTLNDAQRGFEYGTKILQTCDNKVNDNQDVACKVTVKPGNSMGNFGTTSDGLDIINTQAELDQVMNNNSFFVKVVTDMPGNGTGLCNSSGAIYACATTPGNSIVIVAGLSDELWGEVIIHEFGHTRGLPHRDAPGNPIMHTSTVGNTEVDDNEASKYHNGGIEEGDNRPVDILFLVDDTGSMSEEIDGVKTVINLVLSTATIFLSNSCEWTFQLATFKDNVSPRDPTTDLNVIKAQVAPLFASGGSDCPEASAEALDALKDKVKDGGTIFLITDASPHAGTNIEATAAALKARGVRVFTILSNDCTSASLAGAKIDASNNDNNGIPYSDNHDDNNSKAAMSTLALSPAPTAIEAYSYICQETGGVFAYVPEVNTGLPADKIRYQNIAYNIILGGVVPAITSVQPGKAPLGSTVAITINGSNTHFNDGTTIAFNDPGITISDITVISNTKITATIKVGTAVPLTFKDIETNTILTDGTIEKASGTGVLEVTTAPLTPTILSISPASGKVGDEVAVKITGINTNFDNTSIPYLGSGIIVHNINAISKEELTATLLIQSDAAIGFRNVTVTTGTEIATENVPGPFLVIGSACTVPPVITGIKISEPNAFCNSLQLQPEYTTGSTSGTLNFIWTFDSTVLFSNSPVINLSPKNTDGIYSLIISDANGCASESISYTYQSQNQISSYNLYALEDAIFGEDNIVKGSVGVRQSSGTVAFGKNTKVPSPAFVKANNIVLHKTAVIDNPIKQAASGITLPTPQQYNGNTVGLPVLIAPPGSSQVFGNAMIVYIRENATVKLTGNNYGRIYIEKGAQVTFSSDSVNIQDVWVDEGDRKALTNLHFAANSNIRVAGKIVLRGNCAVNPNGNKVTFYLLDGKYDEEKFLIKGNNVNVTANVYIPKGNLVVTGGNKDSSNMKGLFIAEKVLSVGHNVTWNTYTCIDEPLLTVARTENPSLPVTSTVTFPAPGTSELMVKVLPNPSSNYFSLIIQSERQEKINIRISDITGRVVESKQGILPNSIVRVGNNYSKGIYFAELTQGKERKLVKLIRTN